MKEKTESEWLARWKGLLRNLIKKPHRVMKTYIDLLDITVDALDKQMCWDCWLEEDWPEEFTETA
jgi:hypothetical protein